MRSRAHGAVSRDHRVVILTALRVEYLAVRHHLSNVVEDQHRGTVYEVGTFESGPRRWQVAVAEIGAGNVSASREAERAIGHFEPGVAMFVGVAGGLKDVALGDVVAATKVYGYESGKDAKSFQTRPDLAKSSHPLVQRALAEGRRDDWRQRVEGPAPAQAPTVFVAPIAAGDKVVASSRSEVYRFLREQYGDALAVEMEGKGFLDAVYASSGVDALVIRGISDLVNRKAQSDREGRQQIAARHAAAFAFEVLAKLTGGAMPAASLLAPNRVPVNTSSPSALLNARYEVVPFFEDVRRKELDLLDTWCRDPTPTSVRLFYGPGGTGKTRLFIEWTRRMHDGQGWDAGFLSDDAGEEGIEAVLATGAPAFVVIDYAETRAALLETLRRVAARAAAGSPPVRVALLARAAGDWWHSLLQLDAAVRHLLTEHEPVQLQEVPLEAALRRRVFNESQAAFAARRGKEVKHAPVDLADPRFGRMLYLHMAALAAVEGLPLHAEKLLDEVVAHEKHFWVRAFGERVGRDLRDDTRFLRAASRVVAAVTLRGGAASKEDAVGICRRVDGPETEDFIAFLRDLYPGQGPGTYLAGMEPDLLGESLVSGVLADPDTGRAYLALVFDAASVGHLRNGFMVLGRIALRDEKQAGDWLAHLLNADVANRARPAFDAAMSLGEQTAFAPLGPFLFDALRREGTSSLAAELEPLIPEQTVSLRELAVWATQRQLVEKPAAAKRARLLNNLGKSLSELGRREEALAAAEEAVETYRKLAAERPDAFLPDLAMSLGSLGTLLLGLRRKSEAVEAFRQGIEAVGASARQVPSGPAARLLAALEQSLERARKDS